MALYHTIFEFREPYQVLLSSDFILAAQRFKLNLSSLLSRTLQGPIKLSTSPFGLLYSAILKKARANILVITQCSISELYANGDKAAIALAKTCERRYCGHISDALSSHDCITACLNISGKNKHRYILATQDETLRAELRQIPGVPMMYIRRAVMIMEPPSPASLARKEVVEQKKLGGVESLGKRKRDDDDDGEKKKRKRKPKEPNPMSVKKKKNTTAPLLVQKAGEHIDTDGENERGVEGNVTIIGEVADSFQRTRATRKRKHHKRSRKPTNEIIPTEVSAEGG